MNLLAIIPLLLIFQEAELPETGFVNSQLSVEAFAMANGTVYDVKAKFTSLEKFLNVFGEKAGVEWVFLNPILGHTLVDIGLEHRTLDEVLFRVLGSAGLTYEKKGSLIEVRNIPTPDSKQGLDWIIQEGKKTAIAAMLTYPGSEEATKLNLLLGELADDEGLMEEANIRYSETIELFPDSKEVAEALFRLGKNHLALGNFAKARGYLADLANHYRDYYQLDKAYFFLARADIQLGNWEQADKELEILLEEFPQVKNQLEPQIYLAEVKRRLGFPQEALEILDPLEYSAMLDQAARPEFLIIHGMTLLENGIYERAAARLFRFYGEHRERLEANPALFSAAQAAFKAGQHFTALVLADLCRSDRSTGVIRGVNPKEWIELYNQIREAMNMTAPVYESSQPLDDYATAKILTRQKRIPDALKILEKLYDDPKIGYQAKITAANFYLKSEQFHKAVDLLQSSIPYIEERELINQAFVILGDAYSALGNYQQAENAYRGILMRQP